MEKTKQKRVSSLLFSSLGKIKSVPSRTHVIHLQNRRVWHPRKLLLVALVPKKLQELLFCFCRSSFFSPVALEGWRGVRMWVWKRKKRGRRGGEGVSQPSLENLAAGQPGGAGAKLKVVSLLVISPLTALLCSIAPAQTNHSCTAVRVTLKQKK